MTLRRRIQTHLVLIGLLVAVLVGGCDGRFEATPSPASAARPSPSLTPEDRASIEFRTLYGLRNDEPFIRMVASDPAARAGITQFGVPLLPYEMEDLRDRAENAHQVYSIIETYGLRHPEAWAGVFLDSAGGGDVVALFTEDVDRHETALRQLLGPLARVSVRAATWSMADLERFAASVEGDLEWLESIGASYLDSTLSVPDNAVFLSISSDLPDATHQVAAHFGDPGWLRVFSDGIGPWRGLYGDLAVRLVDSSGQLVGGDDSEQWLCAITPAQPAAYRGGPLILENGECHSTEPLGATRYDVMISRSTPTGAVVVAQGTVTVPPSGKALLTLHVDR